MSGEVPLVSELALVKGLREGHISAAALDVFETEPYSPRTHESLAQFTDRLILGTHNGSNTKEAVERVSKLCIGKLESFLNTIDTKY